MKFSLHSMLIAVAAFLLGIAYLYGVGFIRAVPFGDPLGPKVFPILLGVGMLASAALLAFEAVRKPVALSPVGDPHDPSNARPLRSGDLTVLGVVVWTALYFWSFEILGYVISSTLYLLPLTCYFNRHKWLANGLTSVLFSLISYMMFTRLLEVHLPPGVLPF